MITTLRAPKTSH